MPASLDAMQAGFDVDQGRGQPSIALVGGSPSFDVLRALLDEAIDGPQAVGGAKRVLEQGCESQSIQGQGFFQAFSQTGGGGLVDQL